MGVDGFSMGNLGINIDMTSAQMANQAERLAQKESETIIKDVTEAAEEDAIKRKDEEDDSEQGQLSGGFDNEQKDENKEEEDEKPLSNLTDKDFANKDPKEFSVKVNSQTDMIELFSNKEGRVLETISSSDLMELVSRLNNASGVLVNRKI